MTIRNLVELKFENSSEAQNLVHPADLVVFLLLS